LGVSPEHPIYLRDAEGNPAGWLPLYALDATHLPPDGDALIAEREGPLTQGKRAALNRKGASYMLELGAGSLNRADRALDLAPAARMAIGVFPLQELGVYAGAHLTVGSKAGGSAVDTRGFLEAQVWPLAASGVHLGAYAEVGATRGSDVVAGKQVDQDGLTYGAGLIGQVELSTFVALTARGGLIGIGGSDRMGRSNTAFSPGFSLGVAVY
jgi:hypothetical protein